MLGIVILSGCGPKMSTGEIPPGTPPDWSSVVLRWNERADAIESLYARGIFEARWVEDDGARRFEQGDLDIWYLQDDRLATRISKFGETYAVTGMNALHHWIYLDGDESVLYVGDRDSGPVGDFRTIPVNPDFYRVVLGLGHLQVGHEPNVTWDAGAAAWRIDLGSGSPAMPSALWIEPDAAYPMRFEFGPGQSDRRLRVEYDSARTRDIALPGRPVTSYPRFSNSLKIVLYVQNEVRNSSLIVLDQMTTDVHDEPVDRVFDLEIMRGGLSPDRVERLQPQANPAESTP
tara:strand:- start:344 stop:1210 length:867 start_codon:yes stop_codon:yes gene_type:complete